MGPTWKQKFERVVTAGSFRKMNDSDYDGLAGASEDALTWDGKGERTVIVFMPSKKEMQVILTFDDGPEVWTRVVPKQSRAEALAKEIDDKEEFYDFKQNFFKKLNQ